MSESKTASTVRASWPAGMGLGVFWFIWGVYGFWWGVLYGLFWPLWLGFKMAAFLVAH